MEIREQVESRGEVELMRIDDCQIDGVKVVELKRRRGRPPGNQMTATTSEDVCFICFDGGSLVLCDRRGCPKAYHPACIKRDEAFFKSTAKWNCGWHICSTCRKTSNYMCYTCTYSLCNNCTKDADYVNVRGNKGFCGLCRTTIMLMESTALGTKEMVQVDFDDQTSWEYLFKLYWTLLKEKLSLTLNEVIKAKNPWKEIVSMESSFGAGYSKRRKTMKQQIEESLEAKKLGVMKAMPLPKSTNCASDKGEINKYPLMLDIKENNPASRLEGSDIGSSQTSITLHSTETELSVNNTETDKIWHYQDPLGKVQGPFSMTMLRRWSMGGHFPLDLKIWRAQEDSTLLTDALDGRYSLVQQVFHKSCEVPRFAPNDGYQNRDGDVRESWDLNVDQKESKQVEESLNTMQNDASGHCCDTNESAKSKAQSSCSAPLDIVTSSAVQTGNHVKGSINMNGYSNETSEGQISAGNVKQDDGEGKSCGQSWRSPSNGWDSNCGLISLVRALEASESNPDIDFPDLPISKSKSEDTESKQSLSSSALHQDSGPSWSTSSSLMGNGPQLSQVAGESCLKRTNLGSDHVATPTSGNGQLTHSSPTDPAENASGCDLIVLEPNEYSFGDESVSDLLAEVEAMESLNGLASPTTSLGCDGELVAQGAEPDFFSYWHP